MQNVVFSMCVKFRYDRLRNDKALGNRNRNSDNNNKKDKNNVRSVWRPVSGSNKGKH